MFIPVINKDKNDTLVYELSVGEEFIPMSEQKPAKATLTVYERMQLDIAKRKLKEAKQKYQARLGKKLRSQRCSEPVLQVIKVPDSPQKHTKMQLDLAWKNKTPGK